MNKPELTPYDHDLIHMVRQLASHIDVSQDKENPENYVLHWSLDKEDEQLREAIVNAIMGRLGSRYIETVGTRVNKTIVKFDPELFPYECRYELIKPNSMYSGEYVRTVHARKFINEELQVSGLASFVGGGTHTVPKTEHPATFEFPDQDGMLLTIKENDYVILENGVFSVMDQSEFEKLYHEKRKADSLSFGNELIQLINRHSEENRSNTHDFILAEYILDCLTAVNKAIVHRDKLKN